MATTTFTNVRVYKDLVVNENFSSPVGFKIIPSQVETRSGDVTGYVLKATSADGKVAWAPGITQTYSLSDLTNTSVALSVADNSVLTFNSSSGNWIATPKLLNLNQLNDVDVSGLVDQSILVYNSTAGEFQVGTLPETMVIGGQEGSIQFKNGSGDLEGNNNILWDNSAKELTFASDSKIIIGGVTVQESDITGLPAAPTSGTSAISKVYFDNELANIASGLVWKEMVEYASTIADDYSADMATLTSTGGPLTIDSNDTFSVGERLLFKNNSSAATSHGIYIVTVAAHPDYTISRSADFSDSSAATGSVMWVDRGALNEGYAFICNTLTGSDVVGTNQLTFIEFNANTSDTLNAGQGLLKSSHTFNLNFNSSTFNVITDNKLDITDTGVIGGSYGSSLNVPTITVNDKGQVINASQQAIGTASTSSDGIITSTDFDSFNSRLNASSLLDGNFWMGSNGLGATQRVMSGDATLGSDGSLSLNTIGTLPIVPFPSTFTTSSIKIPVIGTNQKGIVTSLSEIQLPTATATNFGVISNADWSKFDNKLTSSLTTGQLFVGTGAGSAVAKVVSGDATIDDNGVLTLNDTIASGVIGSSTNVPQLTFDSKGRIVTAIVNPIPTANASTTGLLTGADHVAFTNKMPNTLADGNMFIGDSGNVATPRSLTGDVLLSNQGETTLITRHNPVPVVNYTSGLKVSKVEINSKGLVTSLVGQDLPIASDTVTGILKKEDFLKFNNKLDKATYIGDAKIPIGDGSIVKSVTVSGDVTLDNTGRISILSTISGNKTLPGDINFTCANGDTSTDHTDTNIKVVGSLGVAGKSYFNGDVSASQVSVDTLSIGASVFSDGRITNLNDPTDETDAVNKKYVDDAALGIKWIEPVQLSSTANIINLSTLDPFSNGGKIDNVQLFENYRILVKNQSDKTKNGIYVIKTSTWERSVAFGETEDVINYAAFIKNGDTNGSSAYVVTGTPSIVGTNQIIFTLFSKSTNVSAGTGLTGVTKLSVKTDNSTITLDPTTGNIRMKEVGSISGTYGSGLNVPTMTTDKYGRVITIENTPIQYASYVDTNTKSAGIISGNEYNTFNNKIDSSLLTTGKILIGTGSGPQALNMSGDATLADTGIVTLSSIFVTVPTATNSGITVPDLTIDSKGRVTSLGLSTISYAGPSTAGILSSADYVTFNSKMDGNVLVDNGHILIGDGITRNSVAVSGDVTIDNTGTVTLSSTIVGSKTFSDTVTVNELIITDANGVATPKVTVDDIILTGSLVSASGTISLGSTVLSDGRIEGLLPPVVGTDAVNRDYVDQASAGIKWQDLVITRAGVNVQVVELYHVTTNPDGPTLSTGVDSDPIGGYVVAVNDRVLIDSQIADKEHQGVYYVSSITGGGGTDVHLKRAADFPDGVNVSGFAIYVENGTYGGLSYVISSNPAVVNTDTILASTFAGSSSFTAGVGTSKIVNSLNVNYDDDTIGIQNNSLYVKNSSLGTSKLKDSGVTTIKLADSSVTSNKILNGSVTGVKIAPGSITNSNISNVAGINPSKLSVSTWTLDGASDLTITGTVTAGKIGLGETAKLLLNPSRVLKTSGAQTVGGIKTFADNMVIASATELIQDSDISALTITGGALVKKNFQAKNVYTENIYLTSSAIINAVNINNNNITGVNSFTSSNATCTNSLTVGTVSLTGNAITNVDSITGLLDPTTDTQASNKKYVDDSVNQFAISRNSVKCMTSGELGHPPSGSYATSLTSDITLVDGDRVLVKDQGNTVENGLYTVNTLGIWPRTTDYPTGSKADGLVVYVENSKKFMACTNVGAIVNSAVLVFEAITVAGDGIVSDGNLLSIELEDSSLSFSGTGKLKIGTVPVSSLASDDISVVAGHGILLTDTNDTITTATKLGETLKVDLSLQTDSGLEKTASGLRVLPVTNTRLENSNIVLSTTLNKGIIFKDVSNNEISSLTLGSTVVPEIKLQTYSGLAVTNDGLKVLLPTDFVQDDQIASLDGAKVTASSLANASLVNSITKFNTKTGSGIEISNDDGSTYEDNGTVNVDLGSELNVKISDFVTRNDTSSDITAQKSFTDVTESNGKTSGAVTISGGLGISKDVFSRSINSDTGIIGNITIVAGAITGITSTVNATDAASKNYVDNLTFGLRWTVPVQYATTAVIGIVSNDYTGVGAALTIDDNSSWTVGDRILVKDEIDTQNGIYEIVAEDTGSVILARASDMITTTGATGITLFIESGILNAGVGFTCTEEAPVVFVQFTSGDATDAGDGLSKSGNTISVQVSDGTLVSDNTGVKIASVPLSLLESDIINVTTGSGLVPTFKESDNSTPRTDAVLGGYLNLDLDTNVVKNDVINTFTDTTESINVSTGALIVSGGLGVAKNITSFGLTSNVITDGFAILSSGTLSGLTTVEISDDITLSKGSLQNITSAQDLNLASTNGVVTVENVVFNNSNISSLTGLTMSGDLTIGSVVLSSTGLTGAASISVSTDPTDNNQLTRKSYVDGQINASSLIRSAKDSATFGTTSNITGNIFSGTANVQGIDVGTDTLVIGQRILVKNQTNITFNGIYIVNSGSWTRTTDFNPGKVGDIITVSKGTSNKHKTFTCSSITGGYTFERINKPGIGLTFENDIDYDNVSLNLSGSNKLQVKQIDPALITNRTVQYTYGDGITSTGNPTLAGVAPFPILSVDYDDISMNISTGGKLQIKAVDNSLLSDDTFTVQDSNNIKFTDGTNSVTSVQLSSVLSAEVKLAPNSGLKTSINGIEVDTTVITDKLSNITSSQITSLDSAKLTGIVPNGLLSNDTININAGFGINVKNSLGQNISSVPLGGSMFLSADIIDLNTQQTFNKKITFAENIESTSTSTGAIVVSNGGLGVFGKVTTGGLVTSTSGFKTGTVLISNGLVSGLSNPINLSDAATKSYVDNMVNGSKWKTPVRCATNGPIANFTDLIGTSGLTLNVNPHEYDGVVVALNDRILVKDQATKQHNGIYFVSTYTAVGNVYTAKFTRTADLPSGDYSAGVAVFVSEGSVNAKSGFVCNNEYLTSIVGTHPITWTQISGSAVYSGNNGITLNGSEFNLNIDTQFEFSGKQLTVKSGGIDSAELATDSVITTKISDANVTNAKLANSTYVIETGTGVEIKKSSDPSYSNSITPSLGETIQIRVDDKVILSDGTDQTIAGLISFSDTTASISKITGAVKVVGGLGVQGDIHATSLVSDIVTGTTVTDGVTTLTGGAITGLVTLDVAGDITLSKGSSQTITSAQDLIISSTSGTVTVEGVAVSSGNISGIATINISDDITLSKGTSQTITSAQDLIISSTSGIVNVEDVIIDAGDVSGIVDLSVQNSIVVGDTLGSKVALSVQDGGGDTSIDFKLPNQHGPVGSMLSNNGTGTLSWVSNNVLYTRTVIDHTNYGGVITAYNVNTFDDVIAIKYTDTTQTQNGPVRINLPLISTVGKRKYIFVDEGGKAEVNNITIYPGGSNTILGKSTPLVMSGNYNSYQLYNDGVSKWFIM
jgi:hypothetical protein